MGTTELAVVGHVDSKEEDPGSVVACRGQRGMVSAEWAVGIIAAIGIAGVLIAVVTNGAVQSALLAFILKLIHSFSGMMIGR
ncbi:MAG TPA: DUF4244 domain-containing protein [Microlunatus sp.]